MTLPTRQDRELFAAIRAGREPRASVARVHQVLATLAEELA
jgi:hypothetical protein